MRIAIISVMLLLIMGCTFAIPTTPPAVTSAGENITNEIGDIVAAGATKVGITPEMLAQAAAAANAAGAILPPPISVALQFAGWLLGVIGTVVAASKIRQAKLANEAKDQSDAAALSIAKGADAVLAMVPPTQIPVAKLAMVNEQKLAGTLQTVADIRA